jgi:hypothetical protein
VHTTFNKLRSILSLMHTEQELDAAAPCCCELEQRLLCFYARVVMVPELCGALFCGVSEGGVTRTKATCRVTGLCLLLHEVIPGASLQQQQQEMTAIAVAMKS